MKRWKPSPFQVESMRVYPTPQTGEMPSRVREVKVPPQTAKLSAISRTAPELTAAQLEVIGGRKE